MFEKGAVAEPTVVLDIKAARGQSAQRHSAPEDVFMVIDHAGDRSLEPGSFKLDPLAAGQPGRKETVACGRRLFCRRESGEEN